MKEPITSLELRDAIIANFTNIKKEKIIKLTSTVLLKTNKKENMLDLNVELRGTKIDDRNFKVIVKQNKNDTLSFLELKSPTRSLKSQMHQKVGIIC